MPPTPKQVQGWIRSDSICHFNERRRLILYWKGNARPSSLSMTRLVISLQRWILSFSDQTKGSLFLPTCSIDALPDSWFLDSPTLWNGHHLEAAKCALTLIATMMKLSIRCFDESFLGDGWGNWAVRFRGSKFVQILWPNGADREHRALNEKRQDGRLARGATSLI